METQEKEKDLQKINPKQLKNGNRIMHTNNYLKCKWIKCTNQKTQTCWADEDMCMYALPFNHITLFDSIKLYVIVLYC